VEEVVSTTLISTVNAEATVTDNSVVTSTEVQELAETQLSSCLNSCGGQYSLTPNTYTADANSNYNYNYGGQQQQNNNYGYAAPPMSSGGY